ncbi:MAG: flagellar basal body P-ring protein FlgI [Pseudomonadota bacterium]
MNKFKDFFKELFCKAIIVIALVLFNSTFAFAERLKDLASVSGVRSNPLFGYGLVVGLDGTGDQTSQTPFTIQTFKNMMAQFGISVPENVTPQLKNVAAVSIHAEIPPFMKPGQTIDITVSSIGNAKSLRGGSLLLTPLKGADGQVYALAQGNLVVGGFGAEGSDGSKITVNIPSVGRIPNGATIERAVPNPFASSETLLFNLHNPDFTTAKIIVEAISDLLGPGVATALDAASIQVTAPTNVTQRVHYLSVLENIEVEPAKAIAKVIINSRTGTIVVGESVRVSQAAVTHGSLTVSISEQEEIVQPNALAAGDTAVEQDSNIDIVEETEKMFLFKPGVSLEEIVQAVNSVGASPGDLMAILEALKQAGALKAELIVI